jgi:hypothetical protein
MGSGNPFHSMNNRFTRSLHSIETDSSQKSRGIGGELREEKRGGSAHIRTDDMEWLGVIVIKVLDNLTAGIARSWSGEDDRAALLTSQRRRIPNAHVPSWEGYTRQFQNTCGILLCILRHVRSIEGFCVYSASGEITPSSPSGQNAKHSEGEPTRQKPQ